MLASCQPKMEVSNVDNVVAQAYGNALTVQQLSDRIPDHLSDADSVSRAKSIIQSWSMDQALAAQADRSLPEELKTFDEKIESYRQSLLIYAWEEQYIRTKLDTAVNDTEIESYYKENQQNFLLKGFIVRSRFAALADSVSQTNRIRRLFFSEDAEDVGKLEELLVKKNAAYFLQDETWMRMEELLEQVPLGVFNFESYLKKNEKVEFKKDERLYFLQIKDYRLKDDVSPLELERENIRALIVHQRRKTLLNDMRNSLYQQAVERGEIEMKL